MRGVVNQALNVRTLRPSVNSPTSTFYQANAVVEVVESVIGDFYEGDDLWYMLHDGTFVWAGGVDVQFTGLPVREEDRDQFLISYRKNKGSRPDMDSRAKPDMLTFAPLKLPMHEDLVMVNELIPGAFANGVLESIGQDPRKHVVVYIHGYQPFSSLKLDLFQHFVQNYSNHPSKSIAKMIFMTWPCFGLSRNTRDDEAVELGEHFAQKDFFAVFRELSQALKGKKTLSLFVHSFGHHLLNGMVNPLPANAHKIFDNVFLMAPDITHLAASAKGAELPNIFRESNGRPNIKYAYSMLADLATNVHVFYDKFDFLLYVSTRKSLDKDNRRRDDPNDTIDPSHFRILGNYGADKIDPETDRLGFNYVDVASLVEKATDFGNPLYYPFRKLTAKSMEKIERATDNGDYKGMNGWRLLWNIKRFPDHHRYLFTCKPVVDHVMLLLDQTEKTVDDIDAGRLT